MFVFGGNQQLSAILLPLFSIISLPLKRKVTSVRGVRNYKALVVKSVLLRVSSRQHPNELKNWYKRYDIECHLRRSNPNFYVPNIALKTCEVKAELPPFNFGS